MKKSEYDLLMSIIRTGNGELFISDPVADDGDMAHLIDLGHVTRDLLMVNGNVADQRFAYRVTASGREAADDYRAQRSELLWTRGASIFASAVSIASLIVSVIALTKS